MNKKKLHTLITVSALTFFLLTPLKSEAANYKLVRTGTTMTCVDAQTGKILKSRFISLKGYTYYFNSEGFAHTGWLKLGKNHYFFNANGAMVKKAWINQYYFESNGKMAVNKWVNKTTYVGSDGRAIPGYKKKARAKFVKSSKGTKYRNYDGHYALKTWQCINGRWYYFYSTGYMAKSRRIGSFYVDSRGRMVTNKTVRIGKKRYYYGSDGQLLKTAKIKTSKQKKM